MSKSARRSRRQAHPQTSSETVNHSSNCSAYADLAGASPVQDAAMRKIPTVLVISVASLCLALCSCGDGYLLYQTRYIPDSSEGLSNKEYGQLPSHEPALDGKTTKRVPGSGPRPRPQPSSKYQVSRDAVEFYHAGDDTSSSYLSSERAENVDAPIPPLSTVQP